jgi:PTS system fructose-specific IIA component/PTS system nitrogen regulatory IIA component
MTTESFTSIFEAAKGGSVENVKHFIEVLGVDVNAKDHLGDTPLRWAMYRSDAEVMKYLVSQGAKVNEQNNDGKTPLQSAAYVHDNTVEYMERLIMLGADVNAKDESGFTPMDWASSKEKMEFLRSAGGICKYDKTCELSRRSVRVKFIDYILFDAINPVIKATDKEGVIHEMVQSLVDAGGIKKEEHECVVKAILKREALGSTGIGRGIAMPHIRHPCERSIGAVAISAEGIDFESLDDEKAHLFVMEISPMACAAEHLHIMCHLSTQLKDDMLVESLTQCKTREAIYVLLEEVDSLRYAGVRS